MSREHLAAGDKAGLEQVREFTDVRQRQAE